MVEKQKYIRQIKKETFIASSLNYNACEEEVE
jgi:hypothetical protein